jgi:hypothetical protein
LNKVQDKRRAGARSTFGERFGFARWWQTGTRIDETDAQFVRALGYTSKATASNWRRMAEAPDGVSAEIARRTGLNADWIELGERGAAPEPPMFRRWLKAYRAGLDLSEKPVESGAPMEELTAPQRPLLPLRKTSQSEP